MFHIYLLNRVGYSVRKYAKNLEKYKVNIGYIFKKCHCDKNDEIFSYRNIQDINLKIYCKEFDSIHDIAQTFIFQSLRI